MDARLRAQTERTRARLKDAAPTLGEQEEHLRVFLAQGEPGYELKQLVQHAEGAVSAWRGFVEAVAEAQTAREEAQALLARLKAELETIRPDDMLALDHRELMLQAAAPVRYQLSNLGGLLDSVAPLVPVAQACVVRVVQAAARVGRAWQVEQLTASLRRMEQVVTTLRSPSPEDARLGHLVRRVAELVDMDLPVPQLSWPSEQTPWAPPTLRD
jgi:hypothetical protein